MSDAALAELAAALGPAGCLTGPAMTGASRLHDASGHRAEGLPLALLRPATGDEIAAAMAICHRHGLAVVPQGGLSGLAGAANAGPGQIALSLARFHGIETIDSASGAMVVRAGTVLQTAQEAAAEAGFLLPIDLGARGSCQVGGIVATNAGGVRVLRHGTTRDNVLGLEAVLPDGRVISHLNRVTKDNTGYDLRHLLIGSEGTLAVITRVVLRLRPLPAPPETALCALPDFDAVIALMGDARARLDLSAFEVMWRDHFEMSGGAGLFAERPPLVVLIEAEGGGLEPVLEAAFEAGLITDALLAKSGAEARRFWEIRESLHPTRDLDGLLNLDVSLPVAAMAPFVADCTARVRALDPAADCYFFGHVGDGNLHLMAALPGLDWQAGETALQAAAYDLVRAAGGSISAEHGIGTLKRPFLGQSRSADEIALMRAIKAVFDPAGRMNPGKLLPAQ
ncbi:FAD-binding oxidoreductase [Marinibacterium sp. SX1]|uniref:FAD-binding oxidoreductase n=1 Tax=Marinibacterium sp. SX1 TaxID=3388424 RepID=UPI003D178363